MTFAASEDVLPEKDRHATIAAWAQEPDTLPSIVAWGLRQNDHVFLTLPIPSGRSFPVGE